MPSPITIGVFDSGFGGLTVLRELLAQIPHAHFLYLGDSARLPYGSKSRETVARYAVSAARFLLDRGADLLVIACNTATALALPEIRAAAAPIPVLGVIEPGAQAALALPARALPAATEPHILVLATAATVSSHAYAAALHHLGLAATEKACPLLVPLVEEGWIDHPVTEEVARIYLAEAFAAAPTTSAILLGCTHYPLLQPLFVRTLQQLGRPLPLIDSAHTTAAATAHTVSTLLGPTPPTTTASTLELFATDSVDKFQHLGSRFLGRPLPPVQLIRLPE